MRFRLARVLRLRTQLRRRAQEEVARATAELAVLREQMAASRQTQEAGRAAAEAAVRAGTTGEELACWGRYEQALAAREAALVVAAARLADAHVQARTLLLTRRREERQLECLRERALERHEAAEERTALNLVDDLVLRARTERR